jgi:hypothetical protein
MYFKPLKFIFKPLVVSGNASFPIVTGLSMGTLANEIFVDKEGTFRVFQIFFKIIIFPIFHYRRCSISDSNPFHSMWQ